jgi:D-alanine-D-alanine ligase
MDPKENLIDQLKSENISLVFIALHGTFGEDGTVQKILEDNGFIYTGPGVEASRIAFDKGRTQTLLREKGLPVADFYLITKAEPYHSSRFGVLPLVVKPTRSGSSVGITIVRETGEFEKACHEAFKYSDTVMVEKFIPGRELTVSVLDDKPLPIVEIIPKRAFYDYEAKYKDTGTTYIVPAQISPIQAAEISRLALQTYKTLGCEMMSRVDFILSNEGKAYVLEVNTIPGLTSKSLLPKAARAADIEFPDLCVKILEASLRKKVPTNKP